MFKWIEKRILCLAAAVLITFAPIDNAGALGFMRSVRRSVVKIYVTLQREDYTLPWQNRRPSSGTGTGFIIPGRRLLTNAHIVSDARFIEVQKDGDPARYRARVSRVGHDCDLAVLDVDDASFFEGTTSAELAPRLPGLNDDVTVFGYPMGGVRLSVTKGIVSRIDYSLYSHSGVDQHLVLQVDAAINPGNSGGPIIFKGRVVGLAFQGLAWAENIGYAIPLPVILRFLADLSDGSYDGYPELGVGFINLRNDALRDALGLPVDATGVGIYHVDPFGSARDYLREADVLLNVDGYTIANDGTIDLGDNKVLFAEILERKQSGESVSFEVWRENARLHVSIPLKTPEDRFLFRNEYDTRPEYLVFAGLVFSPLTQGYLRTVKRNRKAPNVQSLFYYSQYAKLDRFHEDRDEFVVLIRRLPHPVNTYAGSFINGVVTEVNGVPVRRLRDVKHALKRPRDGFHILRFADMEEDLVIQASTARASDSAIRRQYGITRPEHFHDE